MPQDISLEEALISKKIRLRLLLQVLWALPIINQHFISPFEGSDSRFMVNQHPHVACTQSTAQNSVETFIVFAIPPMPIFSFTSSGGVSISPVQHLQRLVIHDELVQMILMLVGCTLGPSSSAAIITVCQPTSDGNSRLSDGFSSLFFIFL